MFRKYLFIGLLIMLGTIVVWMILQTRQQERLAAAAAVGLVKSVQTTPTRVFSPDDLEIVESAMDAPPAGGAQATGPAVSAVHRITLRNGGSTTYVRLMLEFAYLGNDGRELETKRHLSGSIRLAPAQELTLGPIGVDGVPRAAVGCRPRIIWAEMERAAAGPAK